MNKNQQAAIVDLHFKLSCLRDVILWACVALVIVAVVFICRDLFTIVIS